MQEAYGAAGAAEKGQKGTGTVGSMHLQCLGDLPMWNASKNANYN